MAQRTTTVPTKSTGETLTAAELNDINDVVNDNAGDVTAQLAGKEATLGNPASDGQVLASTVAGARSWVDTPSATDLDWVIGQTTGTPVIAYGSASVQVNDSGSITLYLLGGNAATSYTVTTGSLPSEFTLESDGSISYTTTAATSTGSFGITPTNPAGDGDEYTVNYEISQANGVAQFTNSESLYPFVRISTSNSFDFQILLKLDTTAWGYPTSTGDGTWVSSTDYPVWGADNGDGTHTYLCRPGGYSYWMLYVGRTSLPSDLTNGAATDLVTGGGAYDLVCPTSEDFTVGTVTYPADQSDVHYGTGQSYITFGSPASLNGFMSSDNSWSYGFRLQQDIPRDGLGRTLFAREGRNWLGFYIGHNDTYTNMIYGNGSSLSYDSEVTAIPLGGFSSGDYVRVTYDGSTAEIFVNGTKYFSYSVSFYWDYATSSDSLTLDFGYGPESNTYQTSATYSHGHWQGLIDRMWIANALVITTDDDGTTYPTGTTHAWDMDETEGVDFAAAIGSVAATGAEV